MYDDPPLSLMPSEYFRRNIAATFMDDPAGVVTRDLAGVTSLMWSSDFPTTRARGPTPARSSNASLRMYRRTTSAEYSQRTRQSSTTSTRARRAVCRS